MGLGLGLNLKGIYQLVALVGLLIKVSTGENLYFDFGLGSDCSFD